MANFISVVQVLDERPAARRGGSLRHLEAGDQLPGPEVHPAYTGRHHFSYQVTFKYSNEMDRSVYS